MLTNLFALLGYLPILTFFQGLFGKVPATGESLPFSLYSPVVDGRQFKIVGTITEVK